jgi:hypothetical protein
MSHRILYILLLALSCVNGYAQDIDYARAVLNKLCSDSFSGRGYVDGGVSKAAEFIKGEFKKNDLLNWNGDYFQQFAYQAVVFPGKVKLEIADEPLEAGTDFIVSPGCPTVNGVFNIFFVDSSTLDNPQEFKEFEKLPFYKTFLVVDGIKGKKLSNLLAVDWIFKNGYKAKGLIYANQEKLTWGSSMDWDKFPVIYIKKGALKRHQLSCRINIESEVNDYNVNNVIGYVKGAKYPDSFLVISAHYDHLGKMGEETMFPGANDNASGVAMMLDLMRKIKANPLPYSVAFMAFGGEEIGLLGSLYYTEKPLFPLSKISMLINLDLMGTGDKGMTVVNATLFPDEFRDLQLLNITNDYLPTVNPRGKASNSDHYYFAEKGVKAFFFYLMGEYCCYHDTGDSADAVTFSRYNQAFTLIHQFMIEYSTKP